jgi:hypothetical protein
MSVRSETAGGYTYEVFAQARQTASVCSVTRRVTLFGSSKATVRSHFRCSELRKLSQDVVGIYFYRRYSTDDGLL